MSCFIWGHKNKHSIIFKKKKKIKGTEEEKFSERSKYCVEHWHYMHKNIKYLERKVGDSKFWIFDLSSYINILIWNFLQILINLLFSLIWPSLPPPRSQYQLVMLPVLANDRQRCDGWQVICAMWPPTPLQKCAIFTKHMATFTEGGEWHIYMYIYI